MRYGFVLAILAVLPALASAQSTTPTTVKIGLAGPIPKIRRATELTAKGMIGAIGDTVPLRATLKSKSDDKPLSGKTLHFKVAGKDVGTAETNTHGDAKFDYKVPNDPPPGATPMQVRFAGDEDWSPSQGAANFAVFKSSTKFTFGSLPAHVNEGETAQISGKLLRITDQLGLNGREISMTVNGKYAGKVTTSNGNFTFSYPVPKNFPFKATVHAQFEGDILYAPTAGEIAFGVMNPAKKAHLTWAGAKGNVGQTVNLAATLSSVSPSGLPGIGVTSAIPGQKVRFWMDRGARWPPPQIDMSHLCQGTTNSAGIATCSVKLEFRAVFYSLYANADVNDDVWSVEQKSDPVLEVNESPVHLALTGPSSAHIGDKVTISVKLTRTSDNRPIANATVDRGNSSKKTDAAGHATFDYTIPSGGTGPKQLKATYNGETEKYLKGEGTITINVLPSVN